MKFNNLQRCVECDGFYPFQVKTINGPAASKVKYDPEKFKDLEFWLMG